MGLREELQRKIDKKSQEIAEAEKHIELERSYLQGMMDMLKMIPANHDSSVQGTKSITLRHGSEVAKAREAILKAGKPLHISDILNALNKPLSTRTGLAGSLSAYVRDGKIFTRPEPNTFGLIELNAAALAPPLSQEAADALEEADDGMTETTEGAQN